MSSAPKQKQHDLSFYVLKWLIVFLIAILLLSLLSKPIRKIWANNYIDQGDEYLLQKKYESAIIEYNKAMLLYWKNPKAKQKIVLAKNARGDVLEMENFYKEKGLSSQLELMREVKTLPENETSAIKIAKEMIEKGEYQYAVIIAKDATEMDRNYRDAWLYLGIANLNAAKMMEIGSEAQGQYKAEAQKALQKAKSLDPEYKPTQDYLDELGKIK